MIDNFFPLVRYSNNSFGSGSCKSRSNTSFICTGGISRTEGNGRMDGIRRINCNGHNGGSTDGSSCTGGKRRTDDIGRISGIGRINGNGRSCGIFGTVGSNRTGGNGRTDNFSRTGDIGRTDGKVRDDVIVLINGNSRTKWQRGCTGGIGCNGGQ